MEAMGKSSSQSDFVLEVDLSLALQQLGMTMDQFIDFCILCGCDYCDSIKGLGPADLRDPRQGSAVEGGREIA